MSEPRSEPIKGLITLVVLIVIVWALYWAAMLYFIEGWQDRGLFGDMFGSVNALFSGAALAGVIYTIFLQRKELQLQRRELEMTREELHRSAEAQEKSEQALREQIKEMQEQSEFQQRPFVIATLKEEDLDSYFVLWNTGNGTAINITLSAIFNTSDGLEHYDCGINCSILTKDQKESIKFRKEHDFYKLMNNEIYVEFENINRKRYFVVEKVVDDKIEIIQFGSLSRHK